MLTSTGIKLGHLSIAVAADRYEIAVLLSLMMFLTFRVGKYFKSQQID